MMRYAPIAFFAYHRPEHTYKALESLIANLEFGESPFYVYCDGAKNEKDLAAVKTTREVISSFKLENITLRERERNWGLAGSIISGVTELCEKYGRVIVLEDDLIVAGNFLSYMNTALDHYAQDEQVMQISGYQFPLSLKTDTEAVFLPFTTSWGWATWQTAWKDFDPDMSGYDSLKKNKARQRKFDLGRAYPYFAMLELQKQGVLDSWAIRWYLSVFMRAGLTLYPSRTLVQNTGLDSSGTHCGGTALYKDILHHEAISAFPPLVGIHDTAFKRVAAFLKRRNSWLGRFTRGIINRFAGSVHAT